MDENFMECRIVYKGQKPTPEQIERLRELKDRPIVFDEDCPELSDEQLKKFKRFYPRPSKDRAAS